MQNRNVIVSLLLLLYFVHPLVAQERDSDRLMPTLQSSDSVATFEPYVVAEVPTLRSNTATAYKPDPIKAIWMGAVIPGYGQILNRKYWKLPIVYGGFLGCAYAITWNANRYTNYKNAYLDIRDGDPNTNSYNLLIPEGYTIESYGGEAAFTNLLRSGMDKARYNRDLTVIISVAYYGLTLIDAFVDAHLYDFDISTDLSMRIRPVIIPNSYSMNPLSRPMALGLGGRINF